MNRETVLLRWLALPADDESATRYRAFCQLLRDCGDGPEAVYRPFADGDLGVGTWADAVMLVCAAWEVHPKEFRRISPLVARGLQRLPWGVSVEPLLHHRLGATPPAPPFGAVASLAGIVAALESLREMSTRFIKVGLYWIGFVFVAYHLFT